MGLGGISVAGGTLALALCGIPYVVAGLSKARPPPTPAPLEKSQFGKYAMPERAIVGELEKCESDSTAG